MSALPATFSVLLLLLLAPILGSCQQPDSSELLARKLDRVTQYQELWEASPRAKDYTIEFQRNCFCPYSGEKIRIDVRGGEVQSFSRSQDSKWPAQTPDYLVVTIEELFAQIRTLSARDVSGEGSLGMEFDEVVGNPTKIWWIDVNGHENEAGFVLRISLVN